MGEDSEEWPWVSQDHIKNILKKEGSIYNKKGRELCTWCYLHLHQLFKFWNSGSLTNHYFCCSHLNKLKMKNKNKKNNKEIHYTSFSVGSVIL